MPRLVSTRSPGIYFETTDADRITGIRSPNGVIVPAGGKQYTTDATAARTLTNDDFGGVINATAAGGLIVTINAGLSPGFVCDFIQSGAAQVSFAVGTGVTLNNVSSHVKSSAVKARVTLINQGAEIYNLSGSTGV